MEARRARAGEDVKIQISLRNTSPAVTFKNIHLKLNPTKNKTNDFTEEVLFDSVAPASTAKSQDGILFSVPKDAKCGEKKAKDGKCGEGKCGEKKNPK